MNASTRALADAHAKLRETGGKNRGPKIDAMNRAVGIPLGSPYCAAGVSASFRPFERPRQPKFPYSGSSQAIRRAFQARDRFSRDPNAMLGWKGAVFGWTNADQAYGHVGIVVGRLTEGGRVTGIKTVEYNTRLSGDRDGEGCFELVRRVCPDGLWRVEDARGRLVGPGRRLWFCNTSDIPGGSWWI